MKDQNAQPGRRGVAALVLLAGIFALLLSATERGTQARIAKNRLASLTQEIALAFAGRDYDNEPSGDVVRIVSEELLGTSQTMSAYRARREGEVVAVALTTVAPDGYVGEIRLIVGIDNRGRVLAVRAIEHRETPGLGDAIDADKSDWIDDFSGRSLAAERPRLWSVRRDGGDIDQITGATVTSRAVASAIRDALHYAEQHRSQLFEQTEN